MKRDATQTVKTDVIVIGSGAAGMAAALTAAEGGAKVIVLEKLRHQGGTSNFAQGLFAVGSTMQRRNYVGLTCDQAFKIVMDYSHWRANPRLVRAVIDKSADTIQWLQANDVQFEEPTTMWPDAPRTWHIIKGAPRAGGRGSVMIKKLIAKAKEKGVEFRFATPVKEILKRGGKVAGVTVDKEGELLSITAKTVIVATGGYANNNDWIKKYTTFDLDTNLVPLGNIKKMGDGIRLAWEAGAAEEGMGVLQLWRGILLGNGIRELGNLNAAALQPHLWVNQRGERFCDETVAHIDPYEGNVCGRQKHGCSYTVFDEATKREMMTSGIDKNMGTENPPGTALTDLDGEFREALKKGNPQIFTADSIDELARKIEVDPVTFRATIDEYNGFCLKGRDALFAKDPQCLRPVKEPTFYAMRCVTMTLGTLGGIKINHRAEALDTDDNTVPGLFAAGSDASGMYGDSYNIYLSGGTLGFAVNSGRIAAESALAYLDRREKGRKNEP